MVDGRTHVTHNLRILLKAIGREILQFLEADNSDMCLFRNDHGFLNLDSLLSTQGVANGDILTSR